MISARCFFDDGKSRKFWNCNFWDHEAVEVEDEDEEGHVHYKMSHAYLLAGSFDEFLTRIAIYERSS